MSSAGNNNAGSPLNNNVSPYLDHLNECEYVQILYCLSVIESESWQWWKAVAGKAAEQMNVRKRQVGEMNRALGQLRVRAEAAEREARQLRRRIAQLENELGAARRGEPPGRDPPDVINGDHLDRHSQQSSTSLIRPPAPDDDDDDTAAHGPHFSFF